MIDVQDLITSRGGDPEKVRETLRKRFAPPQIVDEVIDLWTDAYQGETATALFLFWSTANSRHSPLQGNAIRREDQCTAERDWQTEKGWLTHATMSVGAWTD